MVENYCACISRFSDKVIVDYFSLHVDINKLDVFPHQMPRNERFSAECQFRVQNLLHVVTLHIIQKCKDYKDETKNANHSLANFVKVKYRKDLWRSGINFIRKKLAGLLVQRIFMGGRLPAVAGMPANRTFLELFAGQSDWPEKNCVVLLPKKRRRPVSFRHEEQRFSLWTAPCLSIKSGVYRVTSTIFRLPSLIILWPLH